MSCVMSEEYGGTDDKVRPGTTVSVMRGRSWYSETRTTDDVSNVSGTCIRSFFLFSFPMSRCQTDDNYLE